MLGHLDAVFVVDVTEYDTIFEGRLVEKNRRNDEQSIEPAPRLIDCFGNKVGGEGLVEKLLVFKRIVILRERHGTRIEPAVDYLGRARHFPSALFTSAGKVIEVRAVKLYIPFNSASFFQFRLGAYDFDFAAIGTHPNGQRRSPVAVAGKPPIDDVFEEIAHAAFLDCIGHPVHGTVCGDQAVLDGRHFDKPAGTGVINERRIAAPAEGIAVYDFLRFEKETPSFKILYDQRIGGLRGHSREKIAARREFSLLVNELYDGKIILPPYAIVVLAESGRGVDDARTVGKRNVIVAGDVIRLFAESEFFLSVRI